MRGTRRRTSATPPGLRRRPRAATPPRRCGSSTERLFAFADVLIGKPASTFPGHALMDLENLIGQPGVPGLGRIGLLVDLVSHRAERREIDGVDGKPTTLERLDDSPFVGEAPAVVELGGMVGSLCKRRLLGRRQLVPER